MPQLVEMSPYSMSGDNSMKVFVGKKETSLLLVELETGRIKATLNPNAECLWDPFDEFQRKGEEEEIDLDELEDDRPPRPRRTSTEVFIGRTGESSLHRADTVADTLQTTTSPFILDHWIRTSLGPRFKTSRSPRMDRTTRIMLSKRCTAVQRTSYTSNQCPMGGSCPSRRS